MEEEGGLKLQCLWKLSDFKCGVELINRIYKVVEADGHYPSLHLEAPNEVRAELWTAAIGKLLYLEIIFVPIGKTSTFVRHIPHDISSFPDFNFYRQN